MLRSPTFRADVITAMKAKSLDILVQGVLTCVHKNYTGRSPCEYPGMVDTYWVIVFMVIIKLAVLVCVLIGQMVSDARKDGSGADGKVRKVNELQGKDEGLHDNPGCDGAKSWHGQRS